MNASLEQLRAEIDRLDDHIIPLLNERARHAVAIGQIKKANGDALYVPERERKVLNRLVGQNAGPLSHRAIGRIYREIMASALALEHHDRIHAGGASAAELSRAVAYFAGGNAEVEMAAEPGALVAAFAAEPRSLMIVADGWRSGIAGPLNASGVDARWMGCWTTDPDESGDNHRYHTYCHGDESAFPSGPSTWYCLLQRPVSEQGGPPEWAADLPARSMDYMPLASDPEKGLLRIQCDLDIADIMERWESPLKKHCLAVWKSSGTP